MARVVERSFVGTRGGCLLMLLWVLEGMDEWTEVLGSVEMYAA
jgi:hypothetical protein